MVTIGETHVKKMNACKYLGLTIDKYLPSALTFENVLQEMAMGVQTIDTSMNQLQQHRSCFF